jgi:glycosyltransferase involved in cell wall biosynthesis
VPVDELVALYRRAALLPRPDPLRIFEPLNFYELAASAFGFLPEPFAFSVRALRAIAARLREGARYDIVHDVQCLGWGLLGLRAMGLPLVTTVHHPLSVDRRASFIRDETFRDALGTMTFYPLGMQATVARRVERLFTSSLASAREIERDFGMDPRRIEMVANGVDTDLYRPDPAVARDPDEILCVGRASDPNKGVKTLIEALPALPREVFLTLVDDDHPENGARLRARELGCADRVRITGRVPVDELVALYRRAALVVVPSRYEGFGLPAAEAMACGEALAAGIQRLLGDRRARNRLGDLGRQGVLAAYAWPRVAERTAAVYADVVDRRRGRPASRTTSANPGERAARPSRARSAA